MSLRIVPLLAAFLLIIGVPFLLRPAGGSSVPAKDGPRLIIITPHVTQISAEFGPAFEAWHQRKYGTPVSIDWRGPLGTSEIIKLLQSQYTAAINSGAIAPDGSCKPGTIDYDLVFGGGSFDHGRLKSGEGVIVKVEKDGKQVSKNIPMSVPAGFTQAQLDEWFGRNEIGSALLYDPDQYWIGNALSGFGIVFNRDLLSRFGLKDPTSFEDLANPKLQGMVALADPRQSGSISTAFDAVLSNYGWEKGWRLLREMCANARYFTNSSTKPPIDISLGEGAIGLAIDFYGRSQAQAIARSGEDPSQVRVGYIDPKGTASIDADPVSILRGGPNPEMAKRFVEFVLSIEGQSLWNFRTQNADSPVLDGVKLGPKHYELRRMPIRRIMYEKYWKYLIDQVNPYELASSVKPAGWRSAIGVMMGAFAIDNSEEQRAAWKAINEARGDSSFPKTVLAEMEKTFYAWPTTLGADGKEIPFTPETFQAVRNTWKGPGAQRRAEIAYTKFFQQRYLEVVRLFEQARAKEQL
ncbi:MAG: extracellular solute-binding protein [Phycisphaeraceae bacterium]|nr:extracellular solute-binding protein [Phycisphaeraceae bacterium]